MTRRSLNPPTLARLLSRRSLVGLGLGAAGVTLVGCSAGQALDGGDAVDVAMLAWPSKDEWPEIFWQAPESVQETYRYAVANQDLLKWMPCFCGCVDMGHESNADCYVADLRDDGSVVLDPMSFG